jgi:hypothetical protein
MRRFPSATERRIRAAMPRDGLGAVTVTRASRNRVTVFRVDDDLESEPRRDPVERALAGEVGFAAQA